MARSGIERAITRPHLWGITLKQWRYNFFQLFGDNGGIEGVVFPGNIIAATQARISLTQRR